MKTVSTTEGPVVPEGDALRVLLLLGSNVDAEAQLQAAVLALRQQFSVEAVSDRHWSVAIGRHEAPAYLNQAVLIRTDLDRDQLKHDLRRIEADLGRQRPSPNPGLCPVDIDAVGRWEPGFQLWDAKSYEAEYAQAPLQNLGILTP